MLYVLVDEYLKQEDYLIPADELDEILNKALAAFEGAAVRFSTDAIFDEAIRQSYTENIKRFVQDVKELVDTKQVSVKEAADLCYKTRNQIMFEHRKFTSAQGLSFAEKKKHKPKSQVELLNKYAQEKYKLDFKDLELKQKSIINYELIEASARDNAEFTKFSKKLSKLGKVFILVTATIATYEILNADNKAKETIKQGIQIGGGITGGGLSGLMVSPLCGPGAPFCAVAVVLIGSVIGSIHGSKVADDLDDEIEEFLKWQLN